MPNTSGRGQLGQVADRYLLPGGTGTALLQLVAGEDEAGQRHRAGADQQGEPRPRGGRFVGADVGDARARRRPGGLLDAQPEHPRELARGDRALGRFQRQVLAAEVGQVGGQADGDAELLLPGVEQTQRRGARLGSEVRLFLEQLPDLLEVERPVAHHVVVLDLEHPAQGIGADQAARVGVGEGQDQGLGDHGLGAGLASVRHAS